jgi:hypothetical protein
MDRECHQDDVRSIGDDECCTRLAATNQFVLPQRVVAKLNGCAKPDVPSKLTAHAFIGDCAPAGSRSFLFDDAR